MSETIATQRFRFGKAAAAAPEITASEAQSSSALKLLIVFLLLMYSSIGVIYPATEAVRPAMTVAIGAILFTIFEVSRNRTGFRISWPEGAMVVGLLAVSAISTFGSIYVTLAAQTTLNFAKVVIIYIVIENIITTKDRLRTVLMTMVIGGLIPAAGTVYNYVTHHNLVQGRGAFFGVFNNPNEDAYSLVILVPLAAVLAWRSTWLIRIFLVASIVLYLVGTYVTFSRGGLIGLVAVLGLFGWRQKSFVLKIAMIGLLGIGLTVVGMFWTRKDDFSNVSQDTTVNQRIATFKAGLDMFHDRPLFGVGPGDSMVAYPLYVPKEAHCGCQDQLVVHNAFIQVLGELGALGFIPFIVMLGAAIFHAWRLQRVRDPDLQAYSLGLELALWGFAICGLSGGFAWSWFLYLLVALVAAARQNMTSVKVDNGA
jgi:O-antigen ligase